MTASDDIRAVLLEVRGQVLSRIAGLQRDFASSVEAAAAANADDEHDPEGATIAFERQQVAGHIENAQDRLREVDQALARLDAGRYGICGSCGRPIAVERLRARPAASVCIECAGRA